MQHIGGGVFVLVLAGCGGAAVRAPAGDPPAASTVTATAAPDPLQGADAAAVAAELVRRAQARENLSALDQLVDWAYVQRLARVSGAFVADLDALAATLRGLPASCAPAWSQDEGGHRLDFPPAMVDDPANLAAEKDAVKAELYRGVDVVASCDGVEQLAVQLVRDEAGAWRIRGWTSLAR